MMKRGAKRGVVCLLGGVLFAAGAALAENAAPAGELAQDTLRERSLRNPAVVLPEKYHRDPGAQFCAVYVTGEVGKDILQAVADRNDWVMVMGDESRYEEVDASYRTYRHNRLLRREVSAAELLAADGEVKLRNWFAVSQFTANPKPVTRYGAMVTKAVRGETAAPEVKLPDGWRLVEGDDGLTGCDVRDFYFTVEAYGKNVPPPVVELIWPNVRIGGVYGAEDVAIDGERMTFRPIRKNGPPTQFATIVREGAIRIGWYHQVEGAQHGPYGGKPLPWSEIRASANWRAAARAMFKAADLATYDKTDGANVLLFGFDTNFQNRHVDYPTHFHVMLEWNDFQNNNVGHYTLDPKGFIKKNNFLVCGKVPGYDRAGYYSQPLGATTDYNGKSGKTVFSLAMLKDGSGLVLRKPECATEWKIASDDPVRSVSLFEKSGADWKHLGTWHVEDDTVHGILRIVDEGVETEIVRYDSNTGALAGESTEH